MMRIVQLLLKAALLGAILASLPILAWAQTAPQASASPARSKAKVSRTKSILPVEWTEDDAAQARPRLPLVDDQAASGPAPELPKEEQEPEFLQTLPHPRDEPRSLFQSAPPIGPPPMNIEEPLLTYNPLLDPPQWPQPGWFCDVQTAIVKPYVANEMGEAVVGVLGSTVQFGPQFGLAGLPRLGAAALNWTAAPRFELGYRLPGGMGEFSISDTAMNANGSETFIWADGPASRASNLQFNYTDIDYLSREFMPSENWQMQWRAGLRTIEYSTTTTLSQSFSQAAGGSGVLAAGETNAAWGIGPHFAVELERCFGQSGLSLVGKADVGYNYTTIRQRFSATTTGLVPGGLDNGVTIDRFNNEVIQLNVQLGLAWRPPSYPNSRVFLGYLEETWWNALSNDNSFFSLGQFYYQGVVLRASLNF